VDERNDGNGNDANDDANDEQDPKLMGRMMELHGEMMRTMGDALIKRGKELQQGK
jgi:hypothetical protein